MFSDKMADSSYVENKTKQILITCKLEVIQQNYSRHLINKHPLENAHDMRTFVQQKLSYFRASKTASVTERLRRRSSSRERSISRE